MDLGLSNRVAVVAASSRGLGKAVAFGLAREGARLAMCARDSAALAAAAEEISAATGAEILQRPVDVRDAGQVKNFVGETAARFGRIDICVTNAGGPPSRGFEQASEGDFRDAFELNFLSAVHFAREVLPLMKQRRWGRLIAITSVTVKQPVEGLILSNSVRAGVSGLVKSLANEYGPYNVLVNALCPGYTRTARLEQLAARLAESEGSGAEVIEARWAGQTPLGRVGRPEEFADVAVFLASERASYVTGVSLAVDGGLVKGLY